MNITLNKTDSVNATITIDVVKADYTNEVENALKNLRKNAVIDGFRKGMAPPSLLRQKYGKAVLMDELNNLISKNLYDYIKDNHLNILGEPIPSVDEKESFNFDKQDDYSFSFDIGFAPEITIRLTKKDKVPYYTIAVTEEMINQQVESFKANYGKYSSTEDVQEKDMVKGRLIELNENNEPQEGGIDQAGAVLMPKYMKNEEEKNKFLNAKIHSIVFFNPYAAYDGYEAELSSLLNVKKEEVKDHTGNFSFEIVDITHYEEAEINQELFDKAFEPGTIDSEEAFRAKIQKDLARQFTPESDHKFILDVRKLLEKKASGVQFPDAFLKRWLVASKEEHTVESVEEEYPKIIGDLRFHLIKEALIKANEIKVEESDIREYAKQVVRTQFAQYGMLNISNQLQEEYSQTLLKKEETVRSLFEKAAEDKLIQVLKEKVTLETQELSLEDFQKLFDNE